ncbi:MAG: TetR/AcrR family transcriptional regulator [Actinomycetota bacterium]|nr:TetR/AcrR family transcriptional regulator [Actinomycetota bacterium]
MTKERKPAELRRKEIIEVAVAHFATMGFNATSTASIATDAGISQAYLFRIFPSKSQLISACIDYAFDRVEELLSAASQGLSGGDALLAIGNAYLNYLSDKDLLRAQLQCYAAASDPEIGSLVRQRYKKLWAQVAEIDGIAKEEVRDLFAKGMLITVLAGIEIIDVDPKWVIEAEVFPPCPVCGESPSYDDNMTILPHTH